MDLGRTWYRRIQIQLTVLRSSRARHCCRRIRSCPREVLIYTVMYDSIDNPVVIRQFVHFEPIPNPEFKEARFHQIPTNLRRTCSPSGVRASQLHGWRNIHRLLSVNTCFLPEPTSRYLRYVPSSQTILG